MSATFVVAVGVMSYTLAVVTVLWIVDPQRHSGMTSMFFVGTIILAVACGVVALSEVAAHVRWQ